MGDWDFFGTPGQGQLNYQELQQRRAIAQALASREKGFPKNKGEGLTYLGQSIGDALTDLGAKIMAHRQAAAEKAILDKRVAPTYTPPVEKTNRPEQPATAPGVPPQGAPPAPPPASSKVSEDTTTEQPVQTSVDTTAVGPQVQTADNTIAQTYDPSGVPSTAPVPGIAPTTTAVAGWPDAQPPPSGPSPFPASIRDRIAALVQPVSQDPNQPAALTGGNNVMDVSPPAALPSQADMYALSKTAAPVAAPQAPVEEQPNELDLQAPPAPAPGVPLPRGDPRTVGGVQATMRNEFSRAGYSPNAVGGTMPNARDESGYVWSDASRHFDQPKFRGTEAGFSHGLFQEGGDDWNKMQAWLDKNYPGYSREDPALQARFTAENLKETKPQTFEAMNTAPSEGAAADAMLRGYLKPADRFIAQRSAAYLGGGADGGPAPGTQVALRGGGGGGGGGVEGEPSASGRIGGEPNRDLMAALLLAQSQDQSPQAPEDQAPNEDARLKQILLGGRQPGSPFRATASAGGRAGVVSDAPPVGLDPMGGLGTRDSISNTLMNQPVQQPDPVLPDPTSTTAASTSGPASAPAVVSDIAPAPPFGATAQATSGIPLAGFPSLSGGGAAAPAPLPAQAQAAPAPQQPPPDTQPAPNAPPSAEAIPPAREKDLPPNPGAAPPPPRPRGMSPAQQQALQYKDNPNASEGFRAYWKNVYDTEEKFRSEAEKNDREDYVDTRNRWQEDTRNYQKAQRDAYDGTIKQLNDRVQLEIAQATAAKAPLDKRNLLLTIDNQRADLEKKLYDQGVPRDQARQKVDLEIAELKRKVNDPDKFQAQGTQYERPPGATSYSIPQGAPSPTLSEPQQRAIVFAERAKPDLDLLDGELKYGKALTAPLSGVGSSIPFMSNVLVSQDYRRARNAVDNWASGLLNFVSGSAVSPSEAARNIPAFVPMVGDTDQDLKDKADRRRNLMDVVGKVSGSAGMSIIKSLNDDYLQKDDQVKAARALPPVQVNTLDDAKDLPPGRRLILPDGKPGEVPRRK